MWYAVFFILLFVDAIAHIVCSDLLIWQLSTNYRNEWIKLGRPAGTFYWPEGRSLFLRSKFRYALLRLIFFSTPDWALYDGLTRKILYGLRITFGLFCLSIAVFVLAALLLS